MMIADYIYVGGHTVREARAPARSVALALGGALRLGARRRGSRASSDGTVTVLEHVGFWWHASWVLLFLNLLPVLQALPHHHDHPEHLHASRSTPRASCRTWTTSRARSSATSRSASPSPEHLTWKHILDLYTCTECGRCSDNCPAFTTGKKLSPKHLTLALRDHLYELEPLLPRQRRHRVARLRPGEGGREDGRRAPAGRRATATSRSRWISSADIIDPEVIWACTTCRACEEQCPVNISYVDKIVEMRRDEMMIKNEFPHGAPERLPGHGGQRQPVEPAGDGPRQLGERDRGGRPPDRGAAHRRQPGRRRRSTGSAARRTTTTTPRRPPARWPSCSTTRA